MAKISGKMVDHDTNDLEVVDEKLTLKTNETLEVTASVANTAVTASYVDWNNIINKPSYLN